MTLDHSRMLTRTLTAAGALVTLLALGCLIPEPPDLETEPEMAPRAGNDYWTKLYHPFEEPVDLYPEVEPTVKEEYWAEGPTLFYLPQLPEGAEVVLNGVLEGDAGVWQWTGESWVTFEGELVYGDTDIAPILGVVPYGEVGVAVAFVLEWLFTPTCYETWNCTLSQSQYYGVANYCWYTCIFQSDNPAGCSGLAPGVTVGGHEEWSWFACATTTTVVKES